jgi:acyl-CoA reductase-like NAD-dependent aldehyde dehydrogenase
MLDYIEIGKQEGRLIAGGNAVETPTAASTSPPPSSPTSPHARIAQEEIFGPVLAIIKVEQLRRSPRHRQQHRVRPHRRHLHQLDRDKLDRARASSTSAISTSTASAPAPWSARTPSAAST